MTILLLIISAHAIWAQNSFYESDTIEDFWVKINEQQRTESLEQSCHWEVEKNKFPKGCHELYINFLEEPQSIRVAQKLYQKVNKLCLSKAPLEPDFQKLQGFLAKGFISDECREKVSNRLEDLKYQQTSQFGSNFEQQMSYEELGSSKNTL